MWRFIVYSASLKILLRNAGSKLGLLWEPLSTLIVSIVLATVWIKVLGIEGPLLAYLAYVYCGMVIWGTISSAVSNLCATLVRNAKGLTTRRLPVFSYIFEDIIVSFIPFILALPFVLVFILISGHGISITSIGYMVLGFVLMVLAAFGFSISVGLCAFFLGDVRQLVGAVMRLGFLVTPVIWKAERLDGHEYLLLLNPFYGYLHILRSGFLGEPVESQYLLQAFGVTALLLGVGLVVYRNMDVRIQQRALML